MVFEQRHIDIESKDILAYIKKKKVVSWQELEQQFNAQRGVIKYKIRDQQLFSCLFNKGQYFTIYDLVKDEISDEGLWRYKDIVFSNFGSIEPTLQELITQSKAGYNSKDLKKMLNLDLYHQLKHLVRNKQLNRIKIGYDYFYFALDEETRKRQIKARQEITPDTDMGCEVSYGKNANVKIVEIIDVRKLNPGDYILENFEAVRRVKSGWKKKEVARELNKNPDTIGKICKRFEEQGARGLIKERKQGPYKIKHNVVKKILGKRVENPQKRCEDIGKELRLEGIAVSDESVRDVLKKFDIDKVKKKH